MTCVYVSHVDRRGLNIDYLSCATLVLCETLRGSVQRYIYIFFINYANRPLYRLSVRRSSRTDEQFHGSYLEINFYI